MTLWNIIVVIAVCYIIVTTSMNSLAAKSAFQLIQLYNEASMYMIALMALTYVFNHWSHKDE